MSETVWVSKAPGNTALFADLVSEIMLADLSAAAEASKRYQAGEALAPKEYSRRFFGRYRDKKYEHKKHLIIASGFIVVSGPAYDALTSSRLGSSAFYPVKIFQNDQVTPVEGAFFLFAPTETHLALRPGECGAGLRESPTFPGVYSFRGFPEDNVIAVSARAVPDVDFWIDPKLRNFWFLKDSLASALKAAGLNRWLRMKKVRVVGEGAEPF